MIKSMLRPVTALGLLAVALSLTACGSVDPKTARVDGSWTLAASGIAPKATWKVAPVCSSGPCDFKVDFGLGQPSATYKYDASAGTYTNVISATSDCLRANGSIGAKKAVTVSSRNTFTPTAAKKINGEDSATAATVQSKTTTTISAAGKKAGCKAQGALATVTQKATRTDAGG